jgi:glycosyltransferase involved in cell wall biosynthesis
MGNVVLEAMAMGLPVVLTPYLGLPAEFGRPGEHFVLSAPEPESLAEEVLSLLISPERRQLLGERGRAWVERHMSLSGAVEAYAALYRDLAVQTGEKERSPASD